MGAFVYWQLNDEIRRQAERLIASHYTDLEVSLHAARRVEGQGIELRGLRLIDPRIEGEGAVIAFVDEIFLSCSANLQDIVLKELSVREVVIRRAEVRATRLGDRLWSLAGLWPPPRLSDSAPDIHVEGATLIISDPFKYPASELTLRNLQLSATRPADTGDADSPDSLKIAGSFAADTIERVEFTGSITAEQGQLALAGQVHGLALGREFRESLPTGLHEPLGLLSSLRAEASVDFSVDYDNRRQRSVLLHAVCRIHRGRIEDPRLPYPITDLTAEVQLTDQQVLIERATGRSGQTTFTLSGRRNGYQPTSPVHLAATAENLSIDRELFERLSPSAREVWEKFQPTGTANASISLAFDGQAWHPEIAADLRDVSLLYHAFPYRLEHTTGQVTLNGNHAAWDVVAYAGGEPVYVRGDLVDPGPQAVGWMEVDAKNVPLDEKLLFALKPEAQQVVGAFNPRGTADVYWLARREDPRSEQMQTQLDVTLRGCSIRYDGFAYPLSNINGEIHAKDDHWTFRELKGTNDTGFVTCDGTFAPGPKGKELTLNFTGSDVPLEEELRAALSPAARRMWDLLKPRGRVDLVASLNHVIGQGEPKLAVDITHLGESTSIEPVHFPYQFAKLQGKIAYRSGTVYLQRLRAEHGTTEIALDGTCEIHPGGGWELNLAELSAERVQTDRDLLVALPAGLRTALSELDPSGTVNMNGWLKLAQRNPEAPPSSQWDLTVNLHQANLDCGVPLSNIRGGLRLTGGWDGRRFQSLGELDIDSLTFQGSQVTDVHGPLWIENERVLLGEWVGKQNNLPPRHVTGHLYGGAIIGDGWVMLEEHPRFALEATLNAGDLARFVKERVPGRQMIRGAVQADIHLKGAGRSLHALEGFGEIHLRDADIYELPVVVALLKVLSVRSPDRTAFTTSDMKFRVQGDDITFDQLDLLGDAVSLYGRGTMNLDRELDLTFHSIIGRNDLPLPALRQLVGQASEQIMQIHVAGNFENPQITNQPFPRVNQALQQLQSELERPVPRQSLWSDPRRWFSEGEPSPRRY